MIPFRHHVVSLVAVLLALAAGVALGGGPLQREDAAAPAPAPARTTDALTARAADGFADAAAPLLLGDRLRNVGVALVTMPGADPRTVVALRQRLDDAGALVSGTYEVQESLLAPAQQQLVDSLGTDLVEQQAPELEAATAPYARLGALLARAATSPESLGQDVDGPATSIRDALVAAGLVAVPGEQPARRPAVALVVLGEEPSSAGAAALRSADAVVAGLLGGLRSAAFGVVAVGTTASGDDGQLARLRRQADLADVATVDGVERPLGQVASALAVVRARTGAAGAFGASGADGAVPLG